MQVAIGEDADRTYHYGRHGVIVEQHALTGHGHQGRQDVDHADERKHSRVKQGNLVRHLVHVQRVGPQGGNVDGQ